MGESQPVDRWFGREKSVSLNTLNTQSGEGMFMARDAKEEDFSSRDTVHHEPGTKLAESGTSVNACRSNVAGPLAIVGDLVSSDEMLLETYKRNRAYAKEVVNMGMNIASYFHAWSAKQNRVELDAVWVKLSAKPKGKLVLTLEAVWVRSPRNDDCVFWIERRYDIAKETNSTNVAKLKRYHPSSFHPMVEETENRLAEIRSMLVISTLAQRNLLRMCNMRNFDSRLLR